MADSTLRFRAESRLTYAHAILALVRRARESDEDFSFGPSNVSALEHNGLVVSGPGVPGWADDFMDQVPGLHRADE